MYTTIIFFIGTAFLFVLFSAVFYMLFQNLFGIPYVPSSSKKLKKVLNELQILDGSGKKFLDLGSGDGRIAITASELGYESHGVETNPYLLGISKVWNKVGNHGVNFRRENLFHIPLEEYDVVYAYLLPKSLKSLEATLDRSKNNDLTIITNTFKFEELEPSRVVGEKYYVYKV